MKNSLPVLLISLLGLAISCKKNSDVPGNGGGTTPKEKIAPDGFTFNTVQQVAVNIQLLAPNDQPIAGVPVSVYDGKVTIQPNGQPTPGTALFTGISDKNGYVKATVNAASSLDTVIVNAPYAGLPQNAKCYISGGSLNATLGGSNGIGGNVVPNFAAPVAATNVATSFLPTTSIVPMGSTDNSGRPKYLVSPSDVISNTLLSYINASLPEGIALTKSHPQYITSDATGTVNITAASDVWVTFVTEGAGYTNSLGYYTYPTGNPPSSVSDISTINLVFPNASLYGSGGTMRSGDKVKLGTFQAGTTIGFVLFANGWAGSNTVNAGATKYFSDWKLNPESDDSYKRHSVLLYDDADKLYLTGFEDLPRPAGDQDFNDIVFYTTANPITAISNVGVQPIDQPVDTDGDGVTDIFDQYPTDPTRAYDTYYPSQNSFATLAFEDLWPSTGDYDMNDLVVNYRYKIVSNASNNVVEVFGDYAVQAAGASFQNGFGVQFPFSPSLIKNVTGQRLNANYITSSGNGTEAGQSKAVIIPFDNHTDLINNAGGAYFINTKPDMPKVTGDTAHVYIQFTSPISAATLGSAPFNPFLISNQHREIEIHLPGNAPTDKANTKLFGTGDDASVPSSGIYYVSKTNWPWAISFTTPFVYPQESVIVSDGYLHFLDWSKSGGSSYKDWYSNGAGDYRDNSKLYTK